MEIMELVLKLDKKKYQPILTSRMQIAPIDQRLRLFMHQPPQQIL